MKYGLFYWPQGTLCTILPYLPYFPDRLVVNVHSAGSFNVGEKGGSNHWSYEQLDNPDVTCAALIWATNARQRREAGVTIQISIMYCLKVM